ncbi:hypothetical protein [Rhizobium leguminosarum]|uniref:hypothetical protein n=1 Tax=Rhizobium leguminosarum TaxID=384 RepID=UPI003CC909A4
MNIQVASRLRDANAALPYQLYRFKLASVSACTLSDFGGALYLGVHETGSRPIRPYTVREYRAGKLTHCVIFCPILHVNFPKKGQTIDAVKRRYL